jgi:hypothetical protein
MSKKEKQDLTVREAIEQVVLTPCTWTCVIVHADFCL